ncbi:hypothetical protein FGADI_3679 [Fusarium gaditjirri]|uniref:Uncharacterized protein n=1 Tax=Fusarium gaditjirri TaxID=282569 RepID=A0A8H4X0E6_9HYPO|nr:hypothetical protein FGADI_3679 [Fusarium gaditjirri]
MKQPVRKPLTDYTHLSPSERPVLWSGTGRNQGQWFSEDWVNLSEVPPQRIPQRTQDQNMQKMDLVKRDAIAKS